MIAQQDQRRGHAVMELDSRARKAMKIARLLKIPMGGARKRLLEIGCGSGGIAHWFGDEGPMKWDVEAVDVEDCRMARSGYRFRLVEGVDLPFDDAGFDVVISNHVIEHVGDGLAQRRHLDEVKRVLRPDGVAYLAVPSRWMFVEPHFTLPFLSWLPMSLAHAYVRLAGKGSHYDCRPLTCGRIESMFAGAGLEWRQHTADALRVVFELENPRDRLYRYVLRPLPDGVFETFRRSFPTLIYSLTHR